jgi:hypothetical protein
VPAPGTRLWDVAYAAHGFIPLSAKSRWQRNDAGARLRTFADAYGLDEDQRRDLVPMLARRARAMHGFLADQATAGIQPWANLWEAGHGTAWDADADYIHAHETSWATALLA